MPEIGYATMPVIPTFKGLQQDLERGSSKALVAAGDSGGAKFGDAAGKSAGRRFGTKFRDIAKKGLLAGLGGLAVGATVLGDSISKASDLNETLSKTGQIFGKDATPGLEKFADEAAQKFGQSKQQALDAAATFGVFGKVAGLQGRKLSKFSQRLDGLASDMASFSNTSPEQAIEAIGAALRGEAEPIRAYGVLLDDATLKAEALRLGLLKPVKDAAKIKSAGFNVVKYQEQYNEALREHGKNSFEAREAEAKLGNAQSALQKATAGTIPPLTQQQKVLAAQSAIFRQTKDQQGDFARTSGGLANQQRILAARFENTKASLGKGLLPVATDVVTFLNNKGVPALNNFSDWFTKKGIPAIKRFADRARPFVKDTLTDTRDVLQDIAPYAKKVADAFNSLPAGVKKGLGAAALLGFAGSKIPGVKSGVGAGASAAKGVLGLVTKSKPLPVYVVNNGIGGTGTGTPGKGGKPKIPGTPIPLAALPYAAPLLTGGDQGPKKLTKGQRGANAAIVGLGKYVGTDKGVDKALASKVATDTERAFAAIQKAAKTAGMTVDTYLGSGAFPRTVAAIADVRANLKTASGGARHLVDEVFRVGGAADNSKAHVKTLLDYLKDAEDRATRVQHAVSAARTSKVDRQLGGVYVANMNVNGTTMPEVKREAEHRARHRALGSESFR